MLVTSKLTELGLALPAAPKPIGAYLPAVRTGNLVFLSGQLPTVEGALPDAYTGKVGYNVTMETAQAAARQATLNALAILHETVGLEKVRRIVRIAGYVACTPIFTAQPQVLNAASEIFGALFGEQGKHARMALGAPSLPLDACIELEVIAEVED